MGDGKGSPSGMSLGGALGTVLDFFWKIVFGKERQPGRDPLVLDLDGDGLELTAFNQSRSPMFDLDGDGFLERTGWVRGDDGLLVRDLNGDGRINSVSELFGNPAQTGFEELADLDENDDGIIDASDSAFNTLRVWQDANEDGVTDAGELKTLGEHGITSLSLTTQGPTGEQADNNGHTITEISHFTRTDGTTGDIHDVYFQTDEFNTVYTGGISHDQPVPPAFVLGKEYFVNERLCG